MKMLHRSVVFSAVALLLLLVSTVARSAVLGATVSSVEYDSQKKSVTIHIVNTSQKEISSYTLAIFVTRPDGTSYTSHPGSDWLTGISRGEHGILPGGSYDYVRQFSPEEGTLQATVELVTYTDATAETDNPQLLELATSFWKGQAVAYQKVVEILKQSLSAELPATAALSQLQDVLKTSTKPTEKQMFGTALEENILNLQHMTKTAGMSTNPSLSEKEFVEHLIKINSEQIPERLRLAKTEVLK